MTLLALDVRNAHELSAAYALGRAKHPDACDRMFVTHLSHGCEGLQFWRHEPATWPGKIFDLTLETYRDVSPLWTYQDRSGGIVDVAVTRGIRDVGDQVHDAAIALGLAVQAGHAQHIPGCAVIVFTALVGSVLCEIPAPEAVTSEDLYRLGIARPFKFNGAYADVFASDVERYLDNRDRVDGHYRHPFLMHVGLPLRAAWSHWCAGNLEAARVTLERSDTHKDIDWIVAAKTWLTCEAIRQKIN